MFCQKCGQEMRDDWKVCPKCAEPTVSKQIIVKNEDKQGFFGFFSVPILIIGLMYLWITGSGWFVVLWAVGMVAGYGYKYYSANK